MFQNLVECCIIEMTPMGAAFNKLISKIMGIVRNNRYDEEEKEDRVLL